MKARHARPSPGNALRALALLACAGCVSLDNPGYPHDWPARAAPGPGCPTLTGRYDPRDFDEGQPVPLGRWFDAAASATPAGGRIALDGPSDGRLQVRFLDATGAVLGTTTWREGPDYGCDRGELRRMRSEFIPVGLVGRHTVGFSATVRGDLVVHDLDRGGGVVLFVPAYAAIGRWHLYRSRPAGRAPSP